MSIGGTPLNSNSNQLNSDQLLGQLEDLKRQGKGFGNRQLVVDSKGQLAVKATPFEKFCNWITFKSSFPQEGDAFFKLQAMLKRDYGSFVSEKVLASLIGNKKPITVNEAIGRARLAKGQFQELIQPFQQEIQNLAHKNPIEAQRLGAAWNSMMVSLQPNEAQKQVLCELVGHAKDPSKVLAFAHAATNNPIGARQFLSNLSGLEQNSRSQEFSSLLAEGKSSFVECTRCFWQLSNTDPVANASNQIHYAMQSNPATDGLTRATQGAAEIAKHLITAPGQLANEGFILGLKTMLAEGRMLPGINNAFFAQQLDRLQHDPGLREQLMNIGRNGISPVAHQAIRETLGLPPGAPITPKEAQQAALAALLSPLRQGKVGSCFATSVAINIHDTRPSEMLRDMASLIEKGFIERQNGNAHVQIPFNQSIFKSPTQINTASVSRRSQMASSSQQKPETTGNPLLRCWEYTLATSVESQLCSSKNQKLCPIADRILGPKNASKFMRHVSFEYDASKTITSSVDGNSKTGAFALTYTSPHSGKKFEVQTAEQLHEVLNEFAGKKLKVNSRFRSDVSAFFEGLHGGRLKNILRVQCGLQDLHETKVKDLQSLPDALLGIAGKIASKAQQRGASVPSYAPMNNQRHAFNMRLNDPILQEGIRTGAWESPEKRQAFLRQQLMEPMLAPTLDTNDARSASSMLQFFNDLENRFAALKKHAPSKTALKEVFGRIADELQGKVSYADLAKAAYKALKQEFPRIHDAALQENIMMALAPRCPQMMFADTNWEDNGRPEHWGMQFNPITGQFDVLKGILDDSGKYNFVRSELPGKFDECRIIDDPRILFRR